MSSERSYRLRSGLHQHFTELWHRAVVLATTGGQDIGCIRIQEPREGASDKTVTIVIDALNNIEAKEDWDKNWRDGAARALHQRLSEQLLPRPCMAQPGDFPPRDTILAAAEETLLSLDSIALPLIMKIDAAHSALAAYAPVFDRTAKFLLPYVAVKMFLCYDLSYKRHYIEALFELLERKALTISQDDRALLRKLHERGRRPGGL